MNKEQLLDVLLDLGLAEAYDDLFDDTVTVRDWVSRHEDLVRSNRAIAQAVQADAPHEVKKGYFTDKDEQRQYDAGEKKYNEERAKKQQLADEYQRAKDIKDFSEFRADKGILGNLAALGMKLTPKTAKDVYIKEGYNPTKLAVHGGLGTAANVAELAPGAGAVGKAVTTFAGPAIRAGQEIAEGKELSDVGKNFAADAGLNTVFSYLPLKDAYDYVKRILGQGGRGEKAAKNAVEDVLGQADALADKGEYKTQLASDLEKITNFAYDMQHGNVTDPMKLKFADEIEDTYPELAQSLREEVNLFAKNRRETEIADNFVDNMPDVGTVPDEYRKTLQDKLKEYDKVVSETDAQIPKAREKTLDEFKNAQDEIMTNARMVDNEMFDATGALVEPVKDLSKAVKYANPSTAAKVLAKTKPVVQSTGRLYTGSDSEPTAPTDKEYDSAIEYIIQSNKRMWNAGFKPHAGIELEAWQIAKDRGEI